ncbi:MAG: hypothetical protein KY434_11330 [Actinobacteria bacterium]|nr:hypothetical protein [Actinomycetota bacterium]
MTWHQRTAAGAVLTAMSLGVREAVDHRDDDVAIVQEINLPPFDPDAAVELHVERGGPDDSWVVIRPWLLRRAQ